MGAYHERKMHTANNVSCFCVWRVNDIYFACLWWGRYVSRYYRGFIRWCGNHELLCPTVPRKPSNIRNCTVLPISQTNLRLLNGKLRAGVKISHYQTKVGFWQTVSAFQIAVVRLYRRTRTCTLLAWKIGGTDDESWFVPIMRGETHQNHPAHDIKHFNRWKRSHPKLA